MIQRIQSIFLLLAGIVFFSLFRFSFAKSTEPISEYFSDQVYNIHDHVSFIVLSILGGSLALIAIFLYNNRALQSKISLVVIAIAIVLLILVFSLLYIEGTLSNHADQIQSSVGIYMPIAAILFGILANRGIQKDENTVRSMDRLR